MQDTRVQPLSWEDPLEKEMANHSSILAWKIPWSEEPCRLQFTGLQRVGHDLATEHENDYTHWFQEKDTEHTMQGPHGRSAKGVGAT